MEVITEVRSSGFVAGRQAIPGALDRVEAHRVKVFPPPTQRDTRGIQHKAMDLVHAVRLGPQLLCLLPERINVQR